MDEANYIIKDQTLPSKKEEAQKLRRRAAQFAFQDDILYKHNGQQFDNKKVGNLCEELDIKKHFSSPHHPQENGQVDVVNKTIKYTLKRKLDASKEDWINELPQVLWAIRTTSRTATGEIPFSMAYGAEAMSPVKVSLPSTRRIHFNGLSNDELRRCELDLLEEMRDASQAKLTIYQWKMTRYSNAKVKKKSFHLNELELQIGVFVLQRA
ncbi:unnamed protein product [Fraxinus pennsylvanica]|uniref:Integrase catalytic domain-containing protein n=1 Tax=Fraxinus pennsylvanica TaxID=56036 RepID=A0AAD1Z8D7_9LAMI|nr:unnamed protein product [Fraxinus pennsylvanica]